MEYALTLDFVEEDDVDDVDVAEFGDSRVVVLDMGVGDGDIIGLNVARGEGGLGTLMSRGERGEERRGDEESSEGMFGV